MEYFNEMEVVFDSRSENEGFARVAVAAFMTQMDPVLEEVADVKTAVSEAVTNSIIHGYEGRTSGKITVWCGIEKDKKTILVTVKDQGIIAVLCGCGSLLCRFYLITAVTVSLQFILKRLDLCLL